MVPAWPVPQLHVNMDVEDMVMEPLLEPQLRRQRPGLGQGENRLMKMIFRTTMGFSDASIWLEQDCSRSWTLMRKWSECGEFRGVVCRSWDNGIGFSKWGDYGSSYWGTHGRKPKIF